jgi:hypothetical protein
MLGAVELEGDARGIIATELHLLADERSHFQASAGLDHRVVQPDGYGITEGEMNTAHLKAGDSNRRVTFPEFRSACPVAGRPVPKARWGCATSCALPESHPADSNWEFGRRGLVPVVPMGAGTFPCVAFTWPPIRITKIYMANPEVTMQILTILPKTGGNRYP